MKVIQTKTKEQFVALLNIFESMNFRWNNGDLPSKNPFFWDNYGEFTGLSYEPAFGYSNVFDSKRLGHQVVSFNFFIKSLNNE